MRPEVIVDLKRIPDLIGIRDTGDSFVIGAATPGHLAHGGSSAAFEHRHFHVSSSFSTTLAVQTTSPHAA
jgi:hypothetical protein